MDVGIAENCHKTLVTKRPAVLVAMYGCVSFPSLLCIPSPLLATYLSVLYLSVLLSTSFSPFISPLFCDNFPQLRVILPVVTQYSPSFSISYLLDLQKT